MPRHQTARRRPGRRTRAHATALAGVVATLVLALPLVISALSDDVSAATARPLPAAAPLAAAPHPGAAAPAAAPLPVGAAALGTTAVPLPGTAPHDPATHAAAPGGSSPGTPAPAAPSAGPSSAAPPSAAPGAHPGSHSPAPVTAPLVLDTPVTPLPAPPGRAPFAQYREMHANCAPVSQAADDPIVFPGRPGASHLHTFVGNTAVNASSTPESLVAEGGSSCEDPLDTASYWFPTLLQNGAAVPNTTVTFYYKSGVTDYRTVRPFPPGFRLLVGDVNTPDAASFGGEWDCGNRGGPTRTIPASCRPGAVLIVRYKAPSCWDGVHLDVPDHRSHVVYPVGGACPATHPVAVPMLQSKVAYRLVNGNTSGLRFSSGEGFSFHYDFMNGWDQPRLEELVRHCINGGRQCNGFGIDQHKP